MARGASPRRRRFGPPARRRLAGGARLRRLAERLGVWAEHLWRGARARYERVLAEAVEEHRRRVEEAKRWRPVRAAGVALGRLLKPLAEAAAIVYGLALNLADHIACRTAKLHYVLASPGAAGRTAYIAVLKRKAAHFVRAVVYSETFQALLRHLRTEVGKPLRDAWTTVAKVADAISLAWASRLRPLYDFLSWLLSPLHAVLEIAYSVGQPERALRGDFEACSPHVHDRASRPAWPNWYGDLAKLKASMVREALGAAKGMARSFKSVVAWRLVGLCDPTLGPWTVECYRLMLEDIDRLGITEKCLELAEVLSEG